MPPRHCRHYIISLLPLIIFHFSAMMTCHCDLPPRHAIFIISLFHYSLTVNIFRLSLFASYFHYLITPYYLRHFRHDAADAIHIR
jgi:hypothetical protein